MRNTECRLGLVMAGAVSAGAYTAGVIDFLLQALDEWDAARDRGIDETVPPHTVVIDVIAGASAGGMTAAMLGGLVAGRRHTPLGDTDPGGDVPDNVLFQSWVNAIDIRHFLGTGDLAEPGARLVSLLDSSVLVRIAEKALPLAAAAGERRRYAAADLELILTLGNLRGVPYNLPFAEAFDGRALAGRAGHGMRQHRDYLRFRFAAAPDDALELDWAMQGRNWPLLRQAALATGAFPLGLAARRIERAASDYEQRTFSAPGKGPLADGHCECPKAVRIRPAWGEGRAAPEDYSFISVDGGIFDNEPYELARARLNRERAEATSAATADRILLAIDPFPDTADFSTETYREPGGLLELLVPLLGAMLNQARFKPGELALAVDDETASRRLIAPHRDGTAPGEAQIASGLLGGFSGFLDRRFRFHDFMLGRANCRAFLDKHFTLAADNPLFAGWSAAQRAAHSRAGGRCPVIPLYGRAQGEVPVPPWPRIAPDELADLSKMLKKRLDRLLPELFKEVVPGNALFRKTAVLLARWTQTGDWAKRSLARVRAELATAGLLD